MPFPLAEEDGAGARRGRRWKPKKKNQKKTKKKEKAKAKRQKSIVQLKHERIDGSNGIFLMRSRVCVCVCSFSLVFTFFRNELKMAAEVA